jgi:uncharacterized protein YxjI
MKLYIKQKVFSLRDKYNVYNEAQQPVFTVAGEFSIGAKIHLYDLLGVELFYIEQKLFRFLPRVSHLQSEDLLCNRQEGIFAV